MKAINCLLITTSNNRLGDTLNKTGVWLEDLAAPYFVFRMRGICHDGLAEGGQIPLIRSAGLRRRRPRTRNVFRGIAGHVSFFSFLPLKEVSAAHFDLAFVAGGYGAMWDFRRMKI